jgi:diguanylate cyclase (GGDEF)-like protein
LTTNIQDVGAPAVVENLVAEERAVIEELHPVREDWWVSLAATSPVGIMAIDVELSARYLNARCGEIFNASLDELHGIGWLKRVDPRDATITATTVSQIQVGQPQSVVLRVNSEGGGCRQLSATITRNPCGDYVAWLEDVTEQRDLEERLAHQASHDALTGLPNRRVLSDMIGEYLGKSRRRADAPGVLLFVDLDHFKTVNDTLGHKAGDVLLIEVAERLRSTLRDNDLVVRFGGDEFVILLPGLRQDEAWQVAQRILTVLSEPVSLPGGSSQPVSASMGLVEIDPNYPSADALLRDADVAMYQAKEQGRGQVASFDDKVRALITERAELEAALRDPAAPSRVELLLEPLVNLDTGRLVAARTMSLWRAPSGRPLSGDQLEELMEASQVGAELTGTVFRRAAVAREELTAEVGDIAPNWFSLRFASKSMLESQRFAQRILTLLKINKLDPATVRIEIPAAVAASGTAKLSTAIDELRAAGVKVMLSELGGPHGSPELLKRYRSISGVMLSPSLLVGVGTDPIDTDLYCSFVRLAQSLGLEVVACGIESMMQALALHKAGVNAVSGPAIAESVTVEQFKNLCGVALIPARDSH